jgi:zinc/manganese transport system substrate-binding protein
MNAARTAISLSTLVLTVAISTVAVSACGGERTAGRPDTPTVVASTDVWGSVAEAVAADHATVTSIISGAAADPHSFEASPADAAAIIDASLVVYNGGGYDQWVDDILSNHPDVASIDAYSLLEATARGEPAQSSTPRANEHVFYDLATAKAVATDLAGKLAQADPVHAGEYASNAEAFSREADAVQQIEKSIRTTYPGLAVVATEPVAHYMLIAAGLADKTPPGFSSAIEQDSDPAPVDVAAMLDVINSREIAAVLVNPQTATAVTKQIQAAAQTAGIPIVTITETLPVGSDYLTWQRDTAGRLAAALRQI